MDGESMYTAQQEFDSQHSSSVLPKEAFSTCSCSYSMPCAAFRLVQVGDWMVKVYTEVPFVLRA